MSLIRQFESSRPARPSPLAASTIRDIPLDLLERIRAFPLFSSAPDSFLAAIGSYLRPQMFSPQETILNEGDDAKALYFLVRGGVAVTSKDGESTFAELRPGAFFGEIAILMNMPRSARYVLALDPFAIVFSDMPMPRSVIARYKSLVVRLNKEDLSKVLPDYPDVERVLREEAEERLAILYRRKYEKKAKAPASTSPKPVQASVSRIAKRPRDVLDADTILQLTDSSDEEMAGSLKKRKHPSPELVNITKSSVLSNGTLQIRQLLKKLPLFTDLPDDVLHFLGLNAQPRTYPPFTNIITQGSPGREIFFLTAGEVEVLVAGAPSHSLLAKPPQSSVKARLGTGEFFGEVVSLSLSPKRTATVRSVVAVECLSIPGNVLDELWDRCSPHVREQVEHTANERLKQDPDVAMLDSGKSTLSFSGLALDEPRIAAPGASYPILSTKPGQTSPPAHIPGPEPADFDPFPYPDRSAPRRQHSRRSSIANAPVEASPLAEPRKGSSPVNSVPPSRPLSPMVPQKHRIRHRHASAEGKGDLPDNILAHIFEHLNLVELMECRQVSLHWSKLLTSSPDILHFLDLNFFNRHITDDALVNYVCPFVGQRPRVIILNDCHHIGDEGFSALATQCGANVQKWHMRSAWDISPNVILELADKVQNLREIDFSNVRKISDNLLAFLIGAAGQPPPMNSGNLNVPQREIQRGCPSLCRLKLSYCKGLSDRFMHMLAVFVAPRLRELDLTRCTSISDNGFRYWSQTPFPRLQKLVLADCTYLSDAAMLSLAQSARSLLELDLVRVPFFPHFPLQRNSNSELGSLT